MFTGGGKIQAHCGFNVHTAYKVRLVFDTGTKVPGPYVGGVAVFDVSQPAKYQAPDVQLAGSAGEGIVTLVEEPTATSWVTAVSVDIVNPVGRFG